MRVLLFTGKGGVGKTTVSAATAVRCADLGLRTLVISTDPAHSLADALDVPLGDQPSQLAEHLWGQQLDAQERMEESWGEIQAWLLEVFDWAGVDAIEAEELSLLPGLDEVFALSDIRTIAASGEWDVLVVDCAPTAETIRLLSLPDVLAWYMDHLFPVSRRVSRVVAPVLARVSSLPMAGDDVFGAAERFHRRLDGVRALLRDRSTSSVRLVVNPERMVIAEARRTFTYLSMFGYAVDAVIANRLLPEAISDPWFETWKEVHQRHLATIDESFAPVPVLRAELAAHEPIGLAHLRTLASDIYGDGDPSAVLHDAETMRVERDGTSSVLVLALPFASRDELELGRRDDELLVRVGPYRRAVLLPDGLRRRPVLDAALVEGDLRVTFGSVR